MVCIFRRLQGLLELLGMVRPVSFLVSVACIMHILISGLRSLKWHSVALWMVLCFNNSHYKGGLDNYKGA